MGILEGLRPKKGSTHKSDRLGRGRSCGKGGTGGKGHKGQKARSGGAVIRGFEGGQTPMARRLPKFGFTNAAFKTRYDVVNLKDLSRVDGEINPESLEKAGLAGKQKVKILGEGTLDKALIVRAHKFSASAKETIEKAGGKAEVI